jgi:hypothetical protein
VVLSRISDDMSSEPPSARWLVRELIRRASDRSKTPDDLATVAFEACERTYRDLARDLGTASAQALVSRAQAQAGMAHPAILDVRLYRPRSAGAQPSATARGEDCRATAEEFETFLEALMALLGRFVGINIVARLLDTTSTHDMTPNEGGR